MKLSGFLIVVKDIKKAEKYYHDLFGLETLVDNDGNMILSDGLVLQEEKYWRGFISKDIIPQSNACELYFEEENLDAFYEKLTTLYPETEFVNLPMTHSWGQRVVRFYDPDGNLIEVGTPVKKHMKTNKNTLTIRPETHRDYKDIVSLVLRSFKEGTDYSDGTDIAALIEEIRDSEYYIPELSFVAELDGEIVGHFLFSRFPLSKTPQGGHGGANETDVVMLAPVSVHADHLRQGIGSAMLRIGIEKVKEMGFKGIIVEGNYRFYNTFGFRTSSEYGIYPVSGYPMTEPRCQMCMETYPGSLKDKGGYVVYDMYYNA